MSNLDKTRLKNEAFRATQEDKRKSDHQSKQVYSHRYEHLEKDVGKIHCSRVDCRSSKRPFSRRWNPSHDLSSRPNCKTKQTNSSHRDNNVVECAEECDAAVRWALGAFWGPPRLHELEQGGENNDWKESRASDSKAVFQCRDGHGIQSSVLSCHCALGQELGGLRAAQLSIQAG